MFLAIPSILFSRSFTLGLLGHPLKTELFFNLIVFVFRQSLHSLLDRQTQSFQLLQLFFSIPCPLYYILYITLPTTKINPETDRIGRNASLFPLQFCPSLFILVILSHNKSWQTGHYKTELSLASCERGEGQVEWVETK